MKTRELVRITEDIQVDTKMVRMHYLLPLHLFDTAVHVIHDMTPHEAEVLGSYLIAAANTLRKM
jgi:hypothetical protein